MSVKDELKKAAMAPLVVDTLEELVALMQAIKTRNDETYRDILALAKKLEQRVVPKAEVVDDTKEEEDESEK